MVEKKPIILVICDYYLPGYKSGGGMRTVVNTVDILKEKFIFRIITRDHDGKLDRSSYENVKVNRWNDVNDSKVFYLSKLSIKILSIYRLINNVKPDKIYTNSFFSPLAVNLLILKKLRLTSGVEVIVAPCGEFAVNALEIKSFKKRTFIRAAKFLRLNRNIVWKASTETEALQIQNIMGTTEVIMTAPDLLPKSLIGKADAGRKPEKIVGEAKLVFLSRFVRIKNFKWLIKFLNRIDGNLSIDIYAPLEDEDYWRECVELIKTLPENIKITSRGSVKHDEVVDTLERYHFFILPTLSENFGHICLEAMAAGCPLIVSDRTPWRNLERKKIGWDLSLDNQPDWIEKLNYCVNIDQAQYDELSGNARDFAGRWVGDKENIRLTENVLNYSLKKS